MTNGPKPPATSAGLGVARWAPLWLAALALWLCPAPSAAQPVPPEPPPPEPRPVVQRIDEIELPPGDNNPSQQPHIAVQTAVYLGDLNGDGLPDYFLLPNRTAFRSRLMVSTPGGEHRATPGEYEYGYYAKTHDWDADGRPDMFVKGGQANETPLRIYLIDHSPGLAPDARLRLWQTLTGNESFDVTDLNSDGIKDLTVVHHRALNDASGDPFNVSLYLGTGFPQPESATVPVSPTPVRGGVRRAPGGPLGWDHAPANAGGAPRGDAPVPDRRGRPPSSPRLPAFSTERASSSSPGFSRSRTNQSVASRFEPPATSPCSPPAAARGGSTGSVPATS